jgi:hypothetical protein
MEWMRSEHVRIIDFELFVSRQIGTKRDGNGSQEMTEMTKEYFDQEEHFFIAQSRIDGK